VPLFAYYARCYFQNPAALFRLAFEAQPGLETAAQAASASRGSGLSFFTSFLTSAFVRPRGPPCHPAGRRLHQRAALLRRYDLFDFVARRAVLAGRGPGVRPELRLRRLPGRARGRAPLGPDGRGPPLVPGTRRQLRRPSCGLVGRGAEKQVAAFSGGLPDDIPDSVPVFDMARFDDTEGLCDASAGIGPFGQSTEGQLFSALPGSGRSFHPGLSSSSCAAEETKAEADDAGVRDYFARLMDSLNNSVFVSQLQTVLQATQPWQPPGLFVFGRSGREAAAKLGASEAGPRRIRKRAAGSSRPGTDLEIHITGIRDRLLNLPRNDRRAFLEALPLEDQRALEQHLWSRAADRGLFATAGRMHQPPNQGTRHVRFREPEAEAYFEQTPPDDNFDFFDGSFGADWDGAPLSGI